MNFQETSQATALSNHPSSATTLQRSPRLVRVVLTLTKVSLGLVLRSLTLNPTTSSSSESTMPPVLTEGYKGCRRPRGLHLHRSLVIIFPSDSLALELCNVIINTAPLTVRVSWFFKKSYLLSNLSISFYYIVCQAAGSALDVSRSRDLTLIGDPSTIVYLH